MTFFVNIYNFYIFMRVAEGFYFYCLHNTFSFERRDNNYFRKFLKEYQVLVIDFLLFGVAVTILGSFYDAFLIFLGFKMGFIPPICH